MACFGLLMLLQLFIVLSGVFHSSRIVCGQNFTLEPKNLLPCQVETSTVSLNQSDVLAIQADLRLCSSSWIKNNYNGFRMHVKSEAGKKYPVIFIARQKTNGTVSFDIPLQLEGFSLTFSMVDRTVCPIRYNEKFENPRYPLFYIDVFTSSDDPQPYSFMIEPVENFILALDKTISTVTAPSSPQIFYFKIPDNVETVTIEVTTDSRRCAIVSIQNISCPVNDLIENTRSKGIYQTMSTLAFLTVKESQVKDREFFVVIVATSYTICHVNKDRIADDNNYEQVLNITIRDMKPIREYRLLIALPAVLMCLACLACPLTIILLLLILRKCCCSNGCIFYDCFTKNCKKILSSRKCCNGCIYDCYTKCKGMCVKCREREGIYSCYTSVCGDTGRDSDDDQILYNVNDGFMAGRSESSESIDIIANDLAEEPALTLKDEMKSKHYMRLHRHYSVYGWNTITIAIFYALPALQLVFAEQKNLNFSGNQDQCYYNFKCAHPHEFPLFGVKFEFNAFNNVWSNIGYIVLGLTFIFMVAYRHCRHTCRRKEHRMAIAHGYQDPTEKESEDEEGPVDEEEHGEEAIAKKRKSIDTMGVPQFFGIYYAMGAALISEGFMSACYHFCPDDANFQFDTAFMFIIGGLLIIKLLQNRHPYINTSAFIAFFCFAVITLFTLIGIVTNKKSKLNHGIHAVIFVFIIMLLVVFLISFYHFNNWTCCRATKSRILWHTYFELKSILCHDPWYKFVCRCSKSLKSSMKKCNTECVDIKELWRDYFACPVHCCRFTKLAILIPLNIILIVVVYLLFDFASVILAAFVFNFSYLLLMYMCSKCCLCEPCTFLALILLLLLSIWGPALYFFKYKSVTDWRLTPAESRAMNKDCVLGGFYDYHDIWHFLSALGMFFTFMFLLVIDDGVMKTERKKLRIY